MTMTMTTNLSAIADRRDSINQAIRRYESRLREMRRDGMIDSQEYADLLATYREAAAAYTAAVNEAISRHK